MIRPGVYPAAVTPFTEKGRVDPNGVAKILAHFENCGCQGVVLAGTNGEGPSLSAVEKRDLIQIAAPLKGKLDLILGVATPSLDEAIWLCKRAGEFGAVGVLLLPPYYFRAASQRAITDWYWEVLEKSPVPILAYNFPKASGITVTCEMLQELANHPNFAGCKDSSGNPENLASFRSALSKSEHSLFVGDESLLLEALKLGWSGTISGASNVIARFIVAIARDFQIGNIVSAEEKFKLALPVIEAIRKLPQPAHNKACMAVLGLLERADVRLPLSPANDQDISQLMDLVRAKIGSAV